MDYLNENDTNSWFVYELSSHQLADLKKSPSISVLLNIFTEHLDYYENIEEYVFAKENIARFQSSLDIFIYNADIPEFTDIARRSKAKKQIFSLSKVSDNGSFVDGDFIFLREGESIEKVIALEKLPLVGTHNLHNVMAAVLASHSAGATVRDIAEGILTFKPLPNRLETIGTFHDITFVCDTLATIPEATIAALDSYHSQVSTLICGGYDRGQDFSKLAEKILEEKVKYLVLFPVTGEKILEKVQSLSNRDKFSLKYVHVTTMEDAVKHSYENTENGKVCLLSAASPSFSLFKDYEDEARQFIEQVKRFGNIG